MRLKRHLLPVVILAAVTGAETCVALKAQAPRYDVVIKNARVVDGTGSPWFRADIGLRADTIATIARQIDGPSARSIDAAELVVAPGFIDLHVHALGGVGPPPRVLPIVEVPTADNYVRQGVTTLISGPDGFSPIPLRPMLERVAAKGITPNLGTFIGHGSVRYTVLGYENRAPTPPELDRMRELVGQGMRDGAFGLSTGLFYVPGNFGRTEEVIELAKVAGAMGGIHISHIRDEERALVAAVEENIRIGEEGHVPTEITHHNGIGKAAWGKTTDTLRLIDDARKRGVDMSVDVYPYTASSTTIQGALMPQWAQEGGAPAILQRLHDPSIRARILGETERAIQEERGGGDPHNVQISRCEWNSSLDGKRLDEVTVGRGLAPTLRNAAESVL